MSAQTDAEVRELEHAGWYVGWSEASRLWTIRKGGLFASAGGFGEEGKELALRAALAAAWVLVGNPWGGDKSPEMSGESPSTSRGTNRLFPGHGGGE